MIKPLPSDTILNVNVPDIAWGEVQGFLATRLGYRHRSEPMVEARDPKGRRIYWVGAAGQGEDAGSGTDFHAVGQGYVSVTPLTVDLTDRSRLSLIADWLPK